MNEETKKIMLVGDIRKALNNLCEATGHDFSLYIPNKEAQQDYEALEAKYTAFYELPIQERLYASGMSTPPNKKEDK